MKYLLIGLIFLPLFSVAQQHSMLGIENARKELKKALTEAPVEYTFTKKVIGDKQTAIKEAELVLFKTYGRSQIISERPYEVYLIDGYWVINGTIPENSKGGGFLFIMDSKDSRIIKVIHYR